MAHDPGLYSARRPREALTGISYNTGIPQPASALKRSNSISNLNQYAPHTVNHSRSMSGSRASLAPSRPNQPMFQRSSSGSNLVDMGQSTLKRSSSSQMYQSGAGRRSVAPGGGAPLSAQQSTQRRSSVYSRPSSVGPLGHQTFFQPAPVQAGVPRDPRPLKDRNYHNMMGQELLNYLSHNGFEMEMKHSLTTNTMKSPTQKDFNFMFQWLYRRIDPGYRFLKNIDQEVPPILKQLRYPFEKNITKSQLVAVGGQNWSTFLGLLHWMMQLSTMLDRFDAGQYDDACTQAGVDVSGDRIIFDFLTNAYRDWLQVDDGDEGDEEQHLAPHIQDMAMKFDRASERYREELAVLEAENKRLDVQLEELKKNNSDVPKLDNEFKLMEADKAQFEEYFEKGIPKAERYDARIKLLADEVEKIELESREAEVERANLQASVDRQGIAIQDIDRMNTERERLQSGIQTTATRLEEGKRKAADKELEAGRKLEELERVISRYNALSYQIGLIPSTAKHAKGANYELALSLSASLPNFSSSTTQQFGSSTSTGSDRLLSDPQTGYAPQHLLTLDLRGAVKTSLLSLHREIYERRGEAQEADLKNHELLDHIKEAIDDKRSDVEALEHRVRAAEEEFEKTKEVTTTQKAASDTQIEKMEKELAKMRAGLTESVQLMEQREMNTNIEYEQLTHTASALRETLHTEVERMLNDIIKFKVHVQKSLEDYEGFVVEEVEEELGGGGEELYEGGEAGEGAVDYEGEEDVVGDGE
ncbi:MAG: kinetochore-associated Ndc80 complex subunit ndc80 [Piccolia ochrophora]|nr:MAG: kinetochore-associated Ndc80 complex subunit ndc80 [Piccolia ochrophora]